MKKLLILFLFIPLMLVTAQQEDYFPGSVIIKDSARIGKTLEIGAAIKVTGSSAADSGKVLRANAAGQYVPTKLKPWDLGTPTGEGADSLKALCYDGKYRLAAAASSVPWSNVTGKPAVITYIQDSLNARARMAHTQAISTIIGLQTALNAKLDLNGTAYTIYDQGQNDAYNATDIFNAIDAKEPFISKATGFLKWTGAAWSFINQIFLTTEVDGSTSNELQTLTWNSGTLGLSISGGNSVTLSHTHSYEPAITKSVGFAQWNGTSWTFLNQAYALSTHSHDDRYLTLNNAEDYATLFYVDATFSPLGHNHNSAYAPLSHTQEISTIIGLQTALNGKLDINGTAFAIYDQGQNDAYNATDIFNAIDAKEPYITKATGFLKWTGAAWSFINQTFLTAEVDGSTSNELQTLSWNSGTLGLSISNGNSVTLTHDHSGVYEPAITKGTGYAKWTGAAWLFVNETYAPLSHNQAQSTITGLPDSLLNKYTKSESEARYTPYKTISSITAATRGWYRIATSAVNILSNSAILKIDFNTDSVKGSIIFTASANNLFNKTHAEIDQLVFSTSDSTKGLTGIRIVYHNTTASNYAYIEYFNNTARACTTKLHIIDGTGWNTMTQTAGSIPAGYTYKQLVYGTSLNTVTTSPLWRGGIRDRYAPRGTTRTVDLLASDGESVIRLYIQDGSIIDTEDL